MKSIFKWLGRRVAEPTTYAGGAIIATAFGVDAVKASSIAQAVSLILGGGLVAHSEITTDKAEG